MNEQGKTFFSIEGLKRYREEPLIRLYLLHQKRSSLLLPFTSGRGWEWIAGYPVR